MRGVLCVKCHRFCDTEPDGTYFCESCVAAFDRPAAPLTTPQLRGLLAYVENLASYHGFCARHPNDRQRQGQLETYLESEKTDLLRLFHVPAEDWWELGVRGREI